MPKIIIELPESEYQQLLQLKELGISPEKAAANIICLAIYAARLAVEEGQAQEEKSEGGEGGARFCATDN